MPCKQQDPILMSRTHSLKMGVVAYTFNSNPGKTDRRLLGVCRTSILGESVNPRFQ